MLRRAALGSPSTPIVNSTSGRYLTPVVALALATAISLVIHHFTGPHTHPSITVAYLVAIMAGAWWGGYVPGILGCLLAVFVCPYAFNHHFHPNTDPTRLALLLLVSVLISRVAQTRNQTEAALRQANENLDERVRQRTAELERSNAELSRLNEDLNQFAYSASHDLQEPLRMIVIYSQLLERKFKHVLAPPGDEYIANIIQGGKRMEALLKDLLSYSRTLTGAEDAEPVDGNDVMTKALSNLSAAIQESAARVVCDKLPTVNVREVHLLQLFQNLIGNAIKYRSDRPPVVEVSAQPDAESWKFSVKDNGIGIAPQHCDQVFRLFKRLHSFEKYEGTGMGLAICQRIVDRYGGRIWVESEEGHGSTFCFTLPAANGGSAARMDGT